MLSFILNQQVVQTDERPGMVLLEFIRDVNCLSGTKEACREGECGACTVLVGTPRSDGSIAYRACASCLLPIGDVDGCHIVTVEGLSAGPLTLVQELIVEHSASQCGFCTPGVVLSLTGFCLTSRTLCYDDAIDALDGNICRCTGYVAIRNAARALCERLSQTDTAPPARIGVLVSERVLPAYFQNIPQQLSCLRTEPAAESPGAVLVAGSTDLFVQRPEELLESPLSFLSHRQDLNHILPDQGCLRIGAAVTIEDFRLSEDVLRFFPSMRQDLLLHSSTILRNKATLTGNIVNASPVGDVTIMLLALDARLVISAPQGGTREVALANFFQGYKKIDLAQGELITEIIIPLLPEGARFNFEKVSNRVTLDIAAVNTALRLTTALDGSISDLRISAGGVAPIPMLIAGLEAFRGRRPDATTVAAIAQTVATAAAPISDIRGSATYKRLLLGQLVHTHFGASVDAEVLS